MGGKVSCATLAFIAIYANKPEGIDIVVVTGINNIGIGQTNQQIVDELIRFKNVVNNHFEQFNINPPNTVSVCPVIRPPKFVSLVKPENVPSWFTNKKDQIDELNKRIQEEINWPSSIDSAVAMDNYGIRPAGKTGKMSHRKREWREGQPEEGKEREWWRMLHLVHGKKGQAANEISKYFLQKTCPTPQVF